MAEHKNIGNNIVVGVCSGLRPIGIIDDMRTVAFHSNSVDEQKIEYVSNPATNSLGQLVTPYDIKVTLDNPNITEKSFTTNVQVSLIGRNGVVIIPAGTVLNSDMTGTGIPDAVYLRVSYSYQIPNQPGYDSTAGSNMVTFWYDRLVAQTDQYDTSVPYPLTAPLFCNERGLFTSRQITTNHPAVAVVWAPPTLHNPYLEFMWF